jgi:hypothetical protein
MTKQVLTVLGAAPFTMLVALTFVGCGVDQAGIAGADSGDDGSAPDTSPADSTIPDSPAADAPDGSVEGSSGADSDTDGGPDVAADIATDGLGDGGIDDAADSGSDSPPDGASDGSDGGEDGPTETGTNDASDGGDAGDAGDGGTAGPLCPNQECPASETCCAEPVDGGITLGCQGACPGDTIRCTTPADCPGGAPICCATVRLTGGTPPSCSVGSATSSCSAQCSEVLNLSCKTTDTLRLCGAASDCNGDPFGNTFCCLFTVAPTPFCVGSNLMGFATQCF